MAGPVDGLDSVTADAADLPRWDLATIYPEIDGTEFRADLMRLDSTLAEAAALVADTERREREAGTWLRETLELVDTASALFEQLESYCYAAFSVETDNEAAVAALNHVSERNVPLSALMVELNNAVAALEHAAINSEAETDPALSGYRFFLEEARFFHTRQLSAAEESLAADLRRSGADAWSRLHETITSSLTARWDETTTKTVVELRARAFDPDRAVRRRAWELELAAWEGAETPIAFALNGVKGATHTLNLRRGWESTLERSLRQSRVSRAALDAMLGVMREALPIFRRYLHAKARALGIKRLSFYDLFAPVGSSSTEWTFEGALDFIIAQFHDFDPEQATFVENARRNGWIDAQPRPGKVGGGYCTDFPVSGVSRILVNFDGTYDGMSTIAHELGHAWHSAQLRDLPALQREYPMTLAETASIFSEAMVFFQALGEADEDEERYILEQYLQGCTQVIVDILSRFQFESQLMQRRADGEVPARALREMMLEAQRATYGDGLNEHELHPYMWAVKGHYYREGFAFYNFPYAFGQLFGLGLYGVYESEPEGFPARYRSLLRETGRRDAVSLTAEMGFDIESPEFWRTAMERIERLIDRFIAITDER